MSGACERTFDITVSPRGGGPVTGPVTGPAVDDDGDRDEGVLPNAGGPRLAPVALALLLLLAGAATVRRAWRGAGEA